MKFLYNELNKNERKKVQESLLTDSQLQIQFSEMKELVKQLDTFLIKAPEDIVTRIRYASKDLQSPNLRSN